jgi:glycosyltransferase involved in cell wall biosynthesis
LFTDIAQLIEGQVPVYRLNGDIGASEWSGANLATREEIYLARRDLERYSVLLNTSPVTACTYRVIEGLLSGLIPVSVRSKDLALIVEHGRTGFLGETAQELMEYILALNGDMSLCRRISDLSRARACELFHHERFLAEWDQVLRRSVE